MSQTDQRILYDDPPERPKARLSTIVGAVCATVVAMVLLGSIGSPVESASDITSPPPLPIAVMPDLSGRNLIAAGNLLREAGLDPTILDRAEWIADAWIPVGGVSTQTPAPGANIFDPEEVSLVMSSGGPAIGWDDLPVGIQKLVFQTDSLDRSEPVLVVETGSGRAYKTDNLLFGGCAAVDRVKDTFYDLEFNALCPTSPPETIVGWLGDGAMFAIDGLPRQNYLDIASAMTLGPAHPLGRQLWSTSTRRQAPTVAVEGQMIRVMGGYQRFSVSVPPDSDLTPEAIADLITPTDIRGNLVVSLAPPLAFYSKPGMAGSTFGPGRTARRYRLIPGEPFAAPLTVNIVSMPDEITVTVDDAFLDQVEILAIRSTTWSVALIDDWQYAYPAGWTPTDQEGSDLMSGLVSVATFSAPSTDDRCDGYPIGRLRQIGADDAFVSVAIARSTPSRTWLTHLGPDDVPVVSSSVANGCLEGVEAEVRAGSRFHNGVPFDIVIGLGVDVDDEVRNQAFAILDSFEPAPIYEEP